MSPPGPERIPALSVAQMREVDRLMVEELGIELVQMMENAGRALAEHARRALGDDARGRRVVVLAGGGGNGGGGLAAARRLAIILDALIGYSLVGAPREPAGSLIRAANASGVPIVALDVPSGLDADSGEPREPTIRAASTLTLALPKTGLRRPEARPFVGELFLADISVPEAVYARLGLRVGSIFARSDVVPVPSPAGGAGEADLVEGRR